MADNEKYKIDNEDTEQLLDKETEFANINKKAENTASGNDIELNRVLDRSNIEPMVEVQEDITIIEAPDKSGGEYDLEQQTQDIIDSVNAQESIEKAKQSKAKKYSNDINRKIEYKNEYRNDTSFDNEEYIASSYKNEYHNDTSFDNEKHIESSYQNNTDNQLNDKKEQYYATSYTEKKAESNSAETPTYKNSTQNQVSKTDSYKPHEYIEHTQEEKKLQIEEKNFSKVMLTAEKARVNSDIHKFQDTNNSAMKNVGQKIYGCVKGTVDDAVTQDNESKQKIKNTADISRAVLENANTSVLKNQYKNKLTEKNISASTFNNTKKYLKGEDISSIIQNQKRISREVNKQLSSVSNKDFLYLKTSQINRDIKKLEKKNISVVLEKNTKRLEELKKVKELKELNEINSSLMKSKRKGRSSIKDLVFDLMESSGDNSLQGISLGGRGLKAVKIGLKASYYVGQFTMNNAIKPVLKPVGAVGKYVVNKTGLTAQINNTKKAINSTRPVKVARNIKTGIKKELNGGLYKRLQKGGSYLKTKIGNTAVGKAGKKVANSIVGKGTGTVAKGIVKGTGAIGKGFGAISEKLMSAQAAVAKALLFVLSFLGITFLCILILFMVFNITTIFLNRIAADDADLQTYVNVLLEEEDKTTQEIEALKASAREYDDKGNIINGGKYDKITVEYPMGQGTRNIKDILSMMAVRLQQDLSDNNKIKNYVLLLYKNSHILEKKESEFYSCGGCKSKIVCKGHEETHQIINPITKKVTSEWIETTYHSDNDSNCDNYDTVKYCEAKHQDLKVILSIYSLPDLYDFDTADATFPTIDWEGWTENNKEWVQNIYEQNWNDLYPDLIGFESSFTGTPLTDAEIEALIGKLPDNISASRKQVIAVGLSAVGKISYYWAGKPACAGFEGNNFGTTVPADQFGATKKGLDCSGFVKWVFWSAGMFHPEWSWTGDEYNTSSVISKGELIPGDLGFQAVGGSSTNHVGIFLGYNESGQAIWVHCTGGTINNVTVGPTSVFVLYRRPTGL